MNDESSPLLETPGLPIFSATGIPYETEEDPHDVPLTVAEPIDDYGGRNYNYQSWHPSYERGRHPNVIYRRSEEEFFWWYCLCLFFWLLVLIVVIASVSSVYDDDDYMRR